MSIITSRMATTTEWIATNDSFPNNGTATNVTQSEDFFIWMGVCLAATVFGLFLATCTYFKDQHALPENKKKRKEKTERETQEREQKLVDAVKGRSVSAQEFLAALKKKKKDKHLNIEVRAIVQNQEDHPCTVAFKPENKAFNNHQDVITYDHSRVQIESPPEGIETDYINASLIEGCGGIPNEYILSQGPNHKHRESVPIFWQMVWEQGVHCIVMTCALFEHAVQQCAKYWEDMLGKMKTMSFGDIEIRLEESESYMHMTVRTLIVTKTGFPARVIRQYELTGWGDQDEPDPGQTVEFRRRVRLFTNSTTGPMLVHGRYGGGRSAVFVAVDYCLKQLEMENSVDIYSTVLHLRKFRKNMVRTLAQYRAIYETVAAFITSGHTVIPSSHLPAVTQRLSIKDPRINTTGIELEYKNLEKIVKKIELGECAAGHQMENRNKSRDIMLQPPERSRPCLQTGESVEDTDYINAVYVDGYLSANSFIITQWPYKNTVNDVWRLLYDQRIETFVVLNDVKPCRSYPRFWPKKVGGGNERRFGPIGVRYINCIKYPHVIIRVFQLRKFPRQKRVKSRDVSDLIHNTMKLAAINSKSNAAPIQWRYVKMFQIRSDSWPSKQKVPSSIDPLVYLMNFVEEWEENNSIIKQPICVMSKDGVSRCGLYCALSINCSKLQKEGDIDIFNTARMIKRNRPQLISCAEYAFCYMFLSRFVELLHENPQELVPSGVNQVYQNAAFEVADNQPHGNTTEAASLVQQKSNGLEMPIPSPLLNHGGLDAFSRRSSLNDAALQSRRSSAASFKTALEDANELAQIYNGEKTKRPPFLRTDTATVVIEDDRTLTLPAPLAVSSPLEFVSNNIEDPVTNHATTQTKDLAKLSTKKWPAPAVSLVSKPVHQVSCTDIPSTADADDNAEFVMSQENLYEPFEASKDTTAGSNLPYVQNSSKTQTDSAGSELEMSKLEGDETNSPSRSLESGEINTPL